ncbi:MAG TPA: hypothetical protein VHW23_33510 [Kofleriaceae bacterium]|nr:hypothetical protein [Kofleriaceae bacterium]
MSIDIAVSVAQSGALRPLSNKQPDDRPATASEVEVSQAKRDDMAS